MNKNAIDMTFTITNLLIHVQKKNIITKYIIQCTI